MTTLRKGSKGEEVKLLQELLCKAGFKVVVDSDFGEATFKAVVALQKSNSLVADGIVGAKTWAALGRVDTNPRCVDPSVAYNPLSCCITKKANRTIKYLIIHYTAGTTSKAGTAKSMKASWEAKKEASADFGVDDRDMVQFNPDLRNYYCWQTSGKKSITNANSISIEICSSLKAGYDRKKANHEGWYFTDAVLANAERLAKMLMAKFNIPIERVVRHYDVTGKLCPGLVSWNDGDLYDTNGKKTGKKNNSNKWLAFKWRLNH